MANSRQNDFIKLIECAAYRCNTWEAFRDFCALSAISLSNAIQKDETREKEYLSIIKKYDKKEQECFAQALAIVALALDEEVCDFLGEAYQVMGANNKHFGQFFTPLNLSKMMNAITYDFSKPKLFQKVTDPACGSAALLLPICAEMRKTPEKNNSILIIASDLDLVCVYMAYIQLSLCGANAIVAHANTLALETYSTWITISLAVNYEEIKARQRAQMMFDFFAGNNNPEMAEAAQKIEEIAPLIPEKLAEQGLLFDLNDYKKIKNAKQN